MAGPRPSQARLLHRALLYESPEHFARSTARFVREGLERDDTLLAVTTPENLVALVNEIGPEAERIHLHDTAEWHPRPADRLLAVRRMVDELAPGAELRALGEPLWGGIEAVRCEWARYESVVNLALAGAPMRTVCLYDSSLPGHVLDHARHTHPELYCGDSPRPCGEYVAPERFVAGLPGAAAAEGVELPVGQDHHSFRHALAELASAKGLSRQRAEDLTIAANEVASNAEMHGAPPVSARVWTTADELICEIADAGAGIPDPLAGWGLPGAGAREGWGLSIARQLCDALEIHHREHGTAVVLHVSFA